MSQLVVPRGGTKAAIIGASGLLAAEFAGQPEWNGEDAHVHLLVNYPPKVALSALVNSLKGVSSRLVRKKSSPSIRRKLWGAALWSPSYFAGSCGGAPIEFVRQYIEQQRAPHWRHRRMLSASALSFPTMNGEGCRATDQLACSRQLGLK